MSSSDEDESMSLDGVMPVPLAILNKDASLIEEDFGKKVTMELNRLVDSFENILESSILDTKDRVQSQQDNYLIKTQTATFTSGVERLLLLTSDIKAAIVVNDFQVINSQVAPIMRQLKSDIQDLYSTIRSEADTLKADDVIVQDLLLQAEKLALQ